MAPYFYASVLFLLTLILYWRLYRAMSNLITREEFDQKLTTLGPTIVEAVITGVQPVMDALKSHPDDFTTETNLLNDLPNQVAAQIAAHFGGSGAAPSTGTDTTPPADATETTPPAETTPAAPPEHTTQTPPPDASGGVDATAAPPETPTGSDDSSGLIDTETAAGPS